MSSRFVMAFLVAFLIVLCGNASIGRAADAPLGSAEYKASSEHPFGWRGDGTGRFIGATPPTEWSDKRNVVWIADVGNGYASPVIAGDVVLAVAEPDLLVCLNRADGKERWRLRTTPADLTDAKSRAAAGEYQPPQDGTGMAAATPVSDGTTVYIVLGNGVVRAVGLDGTPKWTTYIDAQQNTSYGRSASPILAGGKLIVHVTNLYALDPATGRQIWFNSDAASSYGTPLPAKLNGVDVIITPAGDVVRTSDGKGLGSAIGTCQYSSPIANGDVIYFTGPTSAATRLNEAFKEKDLWSASVTGDIYSSPVLHDGVLFLINSTGDLTAFDTKAADPSKPVIDARSLFGTAAYASITLGGSYVFVTSSQGETVVLEATREAKEVARNTLARGGGASLVFSGRDLLIRDGDRVVCVRKP